MILPLLCLALALLPAGIALANLAILRTPRSDPGQTGLVSILIPARNEAAVIESTVRAALASTGVAVEVLVGDDHSSDATAEIVRGIARHDPRVRLVAVPPLPEGWTGKNNACATLAAAAQGARLLFIDADVSLAPCAAAALAAHAERTGSALVSGVPRQIMESLGEKLTVPMIDFLLLGYLPMPLMRALPDPSLAAACGQLVLVDAPAYAASGGHGAIRGTLHDGLRLPRLMREAGHRTDLVAGQALATCRMYRGFGEAWAGFAKNAQEGMATPRALPVWTVLLFGGHVAPWLVLLAGLASGAAPALMLVALAACLVSLGTRALITLWAEEPISTIPLYPAAICVALAIQWSVLLRRRGAGAAVWKGRSYPLEARPSSSRRSPRSSPLPARGETAEPPSSGARQAQAKPERG